jgi:hypothetical protein
MLNSLLLTLIFSVLGCFSGNVWVVLLPWAASLAVFLAFLLYEPCDDDGVSQGTLGLAAFAPPIFFVLGYALNLWTPSRDFAMGLMIYELITCIAFGEMAGETQRLREARERRVRLIQALPERHQTTKANPRA